MRVGAYVGTHSLQPEQDEQLDRSAAGTAQPVGHRRVELGDLARRQGQVALAEHEPQASAEHVEPFVAFMGLESRCVAAARQE